jgi:hypothetical protein
MLPPVQVQNPKRVIKVLLLVILCIVLVTMLWSIVSTLLGGGSLALLQGYRYDESGYTVGEGTVPYDRITAIELDWIDGRVEIVTCGDTYVSLTESADAPLADAAKLRWRVDENGVLSVKYRKSSWFLGFGHENRSKTLILRIPERMLPTLDSLSVEAASAEVTVNEVTAKHFDYENVSGSLTATNCSFGACELEAASGDISLPDCSIGSAEATLSGGDLLLDSAICPTSLEIETGSGDVELRIPVTSEFTLYHASKKGQLASDFSMEKNPDRYVCGDGKATFSVTTVSGNLYLTQNNDIS